jgi:hypothetical protein
VAASTDGRPICSLAPHMRLCSLPWHDQHFSSDTTLVALAATLEISGHAPQIKPLDDIISLELVDGGG